MTERIRSGYRRLFEVRLLHHYWLDDGAKVFDQIADQAKRLLTYDVRLVVDVVPTTSTERALSGYRCLFRQTTLGFVVVAPDTAVVAPDAVFDFVVSLKNSAFSDYTSLTLLPRKLYEFYDSGEKVAYRYKENVPVLSNLTGTKRSIGASTTLFISREIPAQSVNDQVESLVLTAGALLQLTSDGPGATTQQLAAQATDYPVYVHQADAPIIVPPAGIAGTPARGVRLATDIPDNVFALIRVQATRVDDEAFSFVDGAGAPKTPAPVYEVRFRNRSTLWTYLKKDTGAVASKEANPLPLTFFGNAGTKRKPSQGSVKAATSGTRITNLISEIYV